MVTYGAAKCGSGKGGIKCASGKGFGGCGTGPSNYLKAHKCSDNTVVNIGMTVANATLIGGSPVAFKYSGTCYYFTLSDTPVSSIGTVLAPGDVAIFSGGCTPCNAICCAPNPTPSALDVTLDIASICGCFDNGTRDVRPNDSLAAVNQTFRAYLVSTSPVCIYVATLSFSWNGYNSRGGLCSDPHFIDGTIVSLLVTPAGIDMVDNIGGMDSAYFYYHGLIDICNGGIYSNQATCGFGAIRDGFGTGGSATVVPVA